MEKRDQLNGYLKYVQFKLSPNENTCEDCYQWICMKNAEQHIITNIEAKRLMELYNYGSNESKRSIANILKQHESLEKQMDFVQKV